MDYPVNLVEQLQAQLKSLRKRAGLTQAEVGSRLGVSQSRVAEIESNPGLVSTEKMLQLLGELGVDVVLRERAPEPALGPKTPSVDFSPLYEALAKSYSLRPKEVESTVRKLQRQVAAGLAPTHGQMLLRKTRLAQPDGDVGAFAKMLRLHPADLHRALRELKTPESRTPGLHKPKPAGSW